MTLLCLSFLFLFVTSDLISLKNRILNQHQVAYYFPVGIKDSYTVNKLDTIYSGNPITGAITQGTVTKVYKSLKITWEGGTVEDTPQETAGLTPQKPWLIARYGSGSQDAAKKEVTAFIYDLKDTENPIKLNTHLMEWFDGSTIPKWKLEIEAIADGTKAGPSGTTYVHSTKEVPTDLNPKIQFNDPNFKAIGDDSSYASQIINKLWPNKFSSIEVATKSARYRSWKDGAWFASDVMASDVAHIDIASLQDSDKDPTYVSSVKATGQWGFKGILDNAFPVKLSAHLREYMYFNIWVPFRNYNECPLGVLDFHFVKDRDKTFPYFSTPSRRNRWYSPSTMKLGDAIVFDGVFSVIHTALRPIPLPYPAYVDPEEEGKIKCTRESIEIRVRCKCANPPCYDWATVWDKLT